MEDSRIATYQHIQIVQKFINLAIIDLLKRSEAHDQSKLVDPEKSIFDEYTCKLRDLTYGSPEYNECLEKMKVGLDHHYSKNRHHPQFYPNGIKDMTLFDLLEMLLDWKAATMRHNDGDVGKSIEINQERFGYSDEFKQIFKNTIDYINKNWTT